MNKNTLFIILVVLVVAAGIYMSTSSSETENIGENSNMKAEEVSMDKDDSMMKDDAIREEEEGFGNDLTMKDDDSMMKDEDDSMMMAAGEYVDYDSQLLERANDGDVVLFFHAGWCPTCKVLDSGLKAELSSFPKDLTILKVDYDNSSELKKKYGVTYQHTLVQVNAQGNMIAKWNGGNDLEDVLNKLK